MRTDPSCPLERSGQKWLAMELPFQGSGGSVDEAIATARESGIVIEREYRQQRLIPAFMEPRSVVVDPTGEQITNNCFKCHFPAAVGEKIPEVMQMLGLDDVVNRLEKK